jgi:purine nucleosidase
MNEERNDDDGPDRRRFMAWAMLSGALPLLMPPSACAEDAPSTPLTAPAPAGPAGAPGAGAAQRLVPEVPAVDQQLRVIIDTDAANEIDDLYAIALAVASPGRLAIEGFLATHFAQKAGPESIAQSYHAIREVLTAAGVDGRYPVKLGGNPLAYRSVPSESEGVDFIIERAHRGDAAHPLWVVGLGAATNLASALVKDPTIAPKVRYVFHARSPETWPTRSVQFNVYGDINAARILLAARVPLVWFDTGANLTAPMAETEARLGSTALGRFLHEYRKRNPYFARADKGFFDMGDIAWLITPDLGTSETVAAPAMNGFMYFEAEPRHGSMLRVSAIDRARSWELFYERIANFKA